MMVRFTQRDASLVRLGEIAMILELHRQGVSVSAIARQVGLDRKTVHKYIERGLEPPLYGPRAPRAPDRLTDLLQSFRARCRQKGYAIQPLLPLRQPGPERIAKEVELDGRVLAFAVGILAVDHLGLLRMKHQSAFSEPLIEGLTKLQGVVLTAAVTDDVVSIPF